MEDGAMQIKRNQLISPSAGGPGAWFRERFSLSPLHSGCPFASETPHQPMEDSHGPPQGCAQCVYENLPN